MSSSPTHSSIAMVLVNFSKSHEHGADDRGSTRPHQEHPPLKRHKSFEHNTPACKEESVPSGQRAISMEQIRMNLMKRRDKLTQEKNERSLMIDAFRQASHSTTSTPIALAPRPETASTAASPMSMHAILGKGTMRSMYVTDDDIIGSAADIAAGLLCRYSTGKCAHLRAQKTDGTYLNLCHMHRVRANANQRKLDRKKGTCWRGMPPPPSASSSCSDSPRSATSSTYGQQEPVYSHELVALVRRLLRPAQRRGGHVSVNNQVDDQDHRHSDDASSSCGSDDTDTCAQNTR